MFTSDRSSLYESQRQVERVRKMRLAQEHGLDFALFDSIWNQPGACPQTDLFNNGIPRFALSIDIWRSAMDMYFLWYEIPIDKHDAIWLTMVKQIQALSYYYYIPIDWKLWLHESTCMCIIYNEQQRLQEKYSPTKPAIGEIRRLHK
jgi:hypothetical protein